MAKENSQSGIARRSAGLFPAGTVASFHSHDFDEMASLPPLWEQHYSQVRRGRYEGSLFMAMTDNLVVSLESSSVGLMIRGSIPPNSAIIAIPFRCSGMSTYRGEQLSDQSAIIVFSGEELDFRSVAPFDVFTFVAERDLLERHAQRIFGRPLESLRRNSQGIVSEPDRVQRRVHAMIGSLSARQVQLGAELLDRELAAAFERETCEEVLRLLAPREPQRRSIRSAELAWAIEEYLRTHLRHDISIADLCRYTGASERTLHLAFREHIGSTPKAYRKILLLNAARRDLHSAPAGTTVTNIAIRWGFLHLGWFAHDYKAMFGESPHETLQHRSRPRTVDRKPRLQFSDSRMWAARGNFHVFGGT
ncbi:MAG: helix-turn-helix domain-containing protein [Phycisphaerales bacterium]|nr:helix-turn-helix domain-containing protein [Phycisphaerales bacterium]